MLIYLRSAGAGAFLCMANEYQILKCGQSTPVRSNDFPNGIPIENDPTHYEPSGVFACNGKKGWQEKGRPVIPAIYDEVEHFEGSNFYLVRQEGRWRYVNSRQEPVLTRVRPIENEAEDAIPFPFCPHESTVITLQEYVGHEMPDDPNVVLLDHEWQRLDRISGAELCGMLVDPSDELPLTERDLELFNSEFAYEFSALTVTSCQPAGISDCLEKLQRADLHCNSWHYIVKVWKAVGEEPSAEELRSLRYQIEKNGMLGDLHFALAHDNRLRAGETRMLAVTHYYERCFPLYFEFDWKGQLEAYPLDQLKRQHQKLVRTINAEVLPEYRRLVKRDQWNWAIAGMGYCSKRKWRDTRKVLDWLGLYDKSFLRGVSAVVEDYAYATARCNNLSAARGRFLLNKLRWMLEHHADPNYHRRGVTALDIIRRGMRCYNEHISDQQRSLMARMRQQCEVLLLEFGAKTMEQLLAEEAANSDYRIELARM